MRTLAYWLLPLAIGTGPAFSAETDPALLRTPSSLTADHQGLHETLERARQTGDDVAVAAEELAAKLGPHFEKEEKFVLPQLGLLTEMAKSGVTPAMRPAIEMGERLRADYGQMLKEHDEIRRAVERLRQAALKEKGRNSSALPIGSKYTPRWRSRCFTRPPSWRARRFRRGWKKTE